MSGSVIPGVVSDDIVPAGRPWGKLISRGEVLRIVDLHGRQAVDFLCYDAADPSDRYSAMNTVKVQGNVDLYNVTNSGSVLADTNAFGARWLVPTLVLEPRILQFSAQITF